MSQAGIPEPVAKPNLLPPNVTVTDDQSNRVLNGEFSDIFKRWCNSVFVAFNAQSQTLTFTQSSFPDLSSVHTGTLIYVSDYAHFIYWDGLVGVFAGDNSGQLVEFLVPPTGPGWHPCDGSLAVPFLKADGSLGTVDLPTTANTYFRQ